MTRVGARWGTAIAALTLGTTVSASARADDTSPPQRSWYGWQALAADGASAGLLVLAGARNSEAILFAGLGAFAVGAPTIHALHAQPGRAAGSLGLRLLVPVVGGFVGFGIGSANCHDASDTFGLGCALGEAVDTALGVMAGMVTASAIDAAFLAWESPPEAPAAAPASPPITTPIDGFSWAPVVTTVRDTASRATPLLGVSGGF